MRRRPALLAGALVALLGAAVRADDAPLLRNAAFDAWADGAPAHWTLGVGARSGEGSDASVVEPLGEKGGVRLRGDGGTRVWRILAQRVRTQEGRSYRLAFEGRLLDARLEAGQFGDAYVGFRRGSSPAPVGVASVAASAWTPGEVVFRGGGEDEVLVFLSETGTLEVRGLSLEALSPSDSLDVMARSMARYYAHFPTTPGFDWAGLVASKRPAFPPDGEPAAFVAAAQDLLAVLRDPHVWIRTPQGRTVVPWLPSVPPNYDFGAVRKALRDAKQVGNVGLVGDVGDDVGYVAVASLQGRDADFAALGAAIDERMSRRVLLLDLRANGGGDERRALDLVGRLTDRPVVYARRRVRIGPAPTDLSEALPATLAPRAAKAYAGSIVVLVGPGCMSSGEGMAQMLRALPRTTFVGQATRGASGNPAPVDLPNGVSVWFSRWVDELPDGTPIEGRGVLPDVTVKHEGAGDPTFDAALRAASAAPPVAPSR